MVCQSATRRAKAHYNACRRQCSIVISEQKSGDMKGKFLQNCTVRCLSCRSLQHAHTRVDHSSASPPGYSGQPGWEFLASSRSTVQKRCRLGQGQTVSHYILRPVKCTPGRSQMQWSDFILKSIDECSGLECDVVVTWRRSLFPTKKTPLGHSGT